MPHKSDNSCAGLQSVTHRRAAMVRRAERRELTSVTRAATTGRETATTGDRKFKLIYIYIENNLLPSVVANHPWVAATQPNTAIRSTGKRMWVIPLSRRWTNVRSHVVTMAGHDTSDRGHMTHVKAGPQTDTPTHPYFPARWVCFFPH
jgi:hypothetical protein